jgi:hypothetical protein
VVDSNSGFYGTFQSHNQKVVANSNGIFTVYSHTSSDTSPGNAWRLARSVDGGRTFSTVFEGLAFSRPPTLETDENGNVYVTLLDYQTDAVSLYRFLAPDYAPPVAPVVVANAAVHGGGESKFTSYYDETRHLLYFLDWSHWLTFGLDGSLLSNAPFFQRASDSCTDQACSQYPLITETTGGDILVAAWTTIKDLPGCAIFGHCYYDNHFVASGNGGADWVEPHGDEPGLPIDPESLATRITSSADVADVEQHAVDNWLANATIDDNCRIHFMVTHNGAMRYIRYEWCTALAPDRGTSIYAPSLTGQRITIIGAGGSGGYFVRDRASGALYAVGNASVAGENGSRLGVLVSTDHGSTWQDHNYSTFSQAAGHANYAVGGYRFTTPDGSIVGTFTDVDTGGGGNAVRFFRIAK